MAIHAHSTPAPADHRGLLQAFADAAPAPTPALTAATVDMLGAIERTARARDIRGRFVKLAPDLPPVPLLPTAPDTLDTIRRDLDALVSSQPAQIRSADQPGNSGFVPNHPDMIGVVADAARTLHLRRQLAQAAEHGAALLASLGLPRLVGPDFVRLDIHTAGDALDLAIATLDDLDADPDLENGADDELSLGWEKPSSQLFLTEGAFGGDRELDMADTEPSLASPERHPAVPISTWGRAWTARGGEEGQLRWAEGARDDREMVLEDGPIDDDELDGAGEVDAEASIGRPEDFTARLDPNLTPMSQADHEADDADLEPDEGRMIVRRPLGLCEPSARDLVARAKAMRSGIVLPGDGFVRPWLNADRVFGLHVEGDCCAPEILSHGAVHVDKEARPMAGDFVTLWFEVERAGRPVLIGWVKRLVTNLPDGLRFPFRLAPGSNVLPVLMVESLNPPRRYQIDVGKVHALFKVVAVIPPAEAIAARRGMARGRHA